MSSSSSSSSWVKEVAPADAAVGRSAVLRNHAASPTLPLPQAFNGVFNWKCLFRASAQGLAAAPCGLLKRLKGSTEENPRASPPRSRRA